MEEPTEIWPGFAGFGNLSREGALKLSVPCL
jgi:hypothetical protein